MTDPELLAQIRTLHLSSRHRKPKTHNYPDEFKRLVVQYARPRREKGMTWAVIAKALPVSSTTARKWLIRAEPGKRSLVPVTIVEDATNVVSQSPAPGLRLTNPAGYQLTGLSLEQAAQLLGHLR